MLLARSSRGLATARGRPAPRATAGTARRRGAMVGVPPFRVLLGSVGVLLMPPPGSRMLMMRGSAASRPCGCAGPPCACCLLTGRAHKPSIKQCPCLPARLRVIAAGPCTAAVQAAAHAAQARRLRAHHTTAQHSPLRRPTSSTHAGGRRDSPPGRRLRQAAHPAAGRAGHAGPGPLPPHARVLWLQRRDQGAAAGQAPHRVGAWGGIRGGGCGAQPQPEALLRSS